MARRRKDNSDQLSLLEARINPAPLVLGVREKVKAWRERGHKGISGTKRILLNYWFYTDHRLPNGSKFAYHYFQREAVETLIYLCEVANVRRHKSLVEAFARRDATTAAEAIDTWPRGGVKMAAGGIQRRRR
jgi:type III restriction enzyme